MGFYWLAVGVLAVWRITHFLHAEDGPFDVGVRLRSLAGAGPLGRVLDCFYCLSVWIAAPLAFVLSEDWKVRMLLWPALSAGAILLERLTVRAPAAPPAAYFEAGGEEHELLRQQTDSLAR